MNKSDLKKLRVQFREAVFKRDGFECAMCDEDRDLDAHHITDRHDMPNGGYVVSNGISLCKKCHWEAETLHRTGGKYGSYGYYPKDLYFIINSSYQKAYADSLNLKPLK